MADSIKTHNSGRPIGIDLFSGAGGLSLGFEQAGFDIVAAVEIDPIHCATHEYNFPYSTMICETVTTLKGKDVRKKANLGDREIDIVFGGPPCQGFSLMGKRVLEDPRNMLVFHFVRLVKELKPKYFLFENVKGLTLGKQRLFLDELIVEFDKCGYDVLSPYEVLNAAEYGVPQDRRRLFLMGARKGLKLPEYPQPSKAKVSVWEAIGDLPDAELFEELVHSDSVKTGWETTSSYGKKLRNLEPDETDYSYNRECDRDALTSSMRTDHTLLSQKRFLETKQGKTETVSRFHKLEMNGLCNTLRAGTDSARGAFTAARPIHPNLPRVITVREAARLHSYPDWFRLHHTKWHGYRQIGNSVPPLLGRVVAAQIIKALGIKPTKPRGSLILTNENLLYFGMSEAARYFGVAKDVIAQRTRKIPITTEQIELHA